MPNVPLDILDRLRQLEDKVRQLEGRSQIRPAMNQVLGDVTIGEGGRLIVKTPGGTNSLFIGAITPNHPDGSPQQGLLVRREDGTIALSVWTGAGTGPQPIQIWDKNGQPIVADDLTGGGLARPYIEGGGWFSVTEYPSAVTASTTLTTVMISPWIKQHPKITAHYLVRASDGTTSGEIQLTDQAGTAIGPVVTVAAGAYYYGSTTGTIAGAHMSAGYLHWRARVNPGSTGTIGVKGLSTYGVQS